MGWSGEPGRWHLAAVACVCNWAEGVAKEEATVRGELHDEGLVGVDSSRGGAHEGVQASRGVCRRSWVGCCPWDKVAKTMPSARVDFVEFTQDGEQEEE